MFGEFTYLHEPGDPVLVLLHGTGGDEAQMLELGKTVFPRAGFLSARGKEPENGANRWFRRLREGVFDLENLHMRAGELAGFVKATVPDARRVAFGFSNGANIAAAILLDDPDAFDGAILFAPMVPFQPVSLPNLDAKPVLMVCGERDPLVPRSNAQALATMFQTAGADLQLLWHKGGHSFGRNELQVAAHWFATHFPA